MTKSAPEEARKVHSDLMLDFAAQRANEFQQGQLPKTTTITQAYGQGKVGIEARIRLRVPEIKPRYWRVIFERTVIKPDFGGLPAFGDTPPGPVWVERMHRHQQQAVLVDVDESVEHMEGGVLREMAVLHSRVWLYGYESIDDAWVRNPVDCERPWLSALIKGRLAEDGEVDVLTGGWSLKYCELAGEVIEGGAQIGQEVPENQAPLGLHCGKPFYPIDLLRGFTITLRDETVEARIERHAKFLLEIAGMEVRPVHFGIYARESGGHRVQSDREGSRRERG